MALVVGRQASFQSVTRIFLSIAVVSLLVAGGCGGAKIEQGVVVRLKIVMDGKPLEGPSSSVPGVTPLEVLLVPIPAAGGEVEPAVKVEPGVFEARRAGKGIKPGKYKVTVLIRDEGGMEGDLLNGKFNETNSTVEITVPEDQLGKTFEAPEIDLGASS